MAEEKPRNVSEQGVSTECLRQSVNELSGGNSIMKKGMTSIEIASISEKLVAPHNVNIPDQFTGTAEKEIAGSWGMSGNCQREALDALTTHAKQPASPVKPGVK